MIVKIRNILNAIKNDYLIVLTYFLVLVAGISIGIFASTSSGVFTIIKDISSVLFPCFGLLIALLGLNSWKKAERLKMICKFANEVRTSCKGEYQKLLFKYDELIFLIEKEEHLTLNGYSAAAKSLRDSNIIHCGQVRALAIPLLEVYKKHYDEFCSIDKELLSEIHILEKKLLPFTWMKIESEYEAEGPYSKIIEHTKELTLKCDKIYRRLVTISGANF